MKGFFKGLAVILGIIAFITVFLWGMYYLDGNGVRVTTSDVYDNEKPAGIEMPIKVSAKIEYDNDYIYRTSKVVEFCDVKQTKKEMKAEVKALWKEMKQGCK